MNYILHSPKFSNDWVSSYSEEAKGWVKSYPIQIIHRKNCEEFFAKHTEFEGVMLAKVFALGLAREDVSSIVSDLFHCDKEDFLYGDFNPNRGEYISAVDRYCNKLSKDGLGLIVPKVRQHGIDAIAEKFDSIKELVGKYSKPASLCLADVM